MRILLAGTTYFPAFNGQAIFMTNLAERLVERGHEVAVLAPSETGPAGASVVKGVRIQRPRTQRLSLWHPNAVFPLFPAKVVDDLIDDFRPQVVHVHDHYPLAWHTVTAARRRGLPVIGSNHFMPENLSPYLPLWRLGRRPYRRLLWRWLLRLYNRLDGVVVQSQAAAVMLQEQGLRRPTHRISCGIDLEDVHVDVELDRSAIRARFGLHPSQPLLLFVGRVDREKLLDVPIRALARIECAGIQLAIAGHGADLAYIQRLAKSKGVADRVHCLGYVSDADKVDLLNSADIFVMPSDAELLSIATLEAMACGRPILAARAQALPELVTDGENGCLFQPGDVEEAAAAIADLAGRPEAWPAMGALSRQHAEAHAWPAVLSRFEQLYAASIASGAAGVAVAEYGGSGS